MLSAWKRARTGLRKQQRYLRRWVLLGLFAGVLLSALPIEIEMAESINSPVSAYQIYATRFVLHASIAFTIGFLMTVLFLPSSSVCSAAATRLTTGAAAAAAVACLSSLLLLILTLSDVLGVPPLHSFSVGALGQFIRELPTGTVLLTQSVLLVAASICAWRIRGRGGARVALSLAVAGASVLAVGGHSAAANNHVLAALSLTGHVLAAVLWVGGLLGLARLAFIDVGLLGLAMPRFSSLALWCVVVVGVTGMINGFLHIGTLDGIFGSSYGALLLLKIGAFLILIAFGVVQRRSLKAASGTARQRFVRLAAGELIVMAAAFGLAVALARANPPVGRSPAPELIPAQAPTVFRLLGTVHLDAFGLLTGLAATVLYATALVKLRRRGDRWPGRRSVAFFCGIGSLVAVTCTGVGQYALATFSMHMVQHMTLNMVAPLLLLLGAPMTLTLRAIEPGTRRVLLRIIASMPVRLISHPIVTTAIFIASLYGLYFTPLFELAMTNHWGHFVMQAHFLLSGLLFFWFILGIDPGPRKIGYAPKIPLLILVMLAHTVFAMVLVFGNSVLGGAYFTRLNLPWLPSLLEDQALGGALAWVLGEMTTVTLLAWVILRWLAAADRLDRAAYRGEMYRARDLDTEAN